MELTEKQLQQNRDIMADAMSRSQAIFGFEECEVDGYRGYIFSFQDDFHEQYRFLIRFENSLYYGYLLNPKIEPRADRLIIHADGEGKVCLDINFVGKRRFDEALEASNQWCRGYSLWRRTGVFPRTYEELESEIKRLNG